MSNEPTSLEQALTEVEAVHTPVPTATNPTIWVQLRAGPKGELFLVAARQGTPESLNGWIRYTPTE